MKKVFRLKLYSAFPGSSPCYREPPQTPGILGGWESWPLPKHVNGQERARVKAAQQLCDHLHLSAAQNRSIVPTLLMEKPTVHFTLPGKKCCLLLPSQISSGSSATIWRTLHSWVPRIYLPVIATIHDTESQDHTRLFIKEEQLWKAWFSLPVFSYKLPDTGFRKLCQEIKI